MPATPMADLVPNRPLLMLHLAKPRGFCAGVVRAIAIVEGVLERFGPPIYVRHEIVHNRTVVESLQRKGVIFVDELSEVPESRPVVFSAHGVPKSVTADAERRGLPAFDATCPLVRKVHREAELHHQAGRHVLLIGHHGHPEVIGTMGQLPDGSATVIQSIADAESFIPAEAASLGYVTQTTLSLDDTRDIVAVLRRRFPAIRGIGQDDICYATANRQQAVKIIASQCQLMLVLGSPNSSNARRLVEVADDAGCPASRLIGAACDIDWIWLRNVSRVGLTAGASVPELLVSEVIDTLRLRYELVVQEVSVAEEDVHFKLPTDLTEHSRRKIPA